MSISSLKQFIKDNGSNETVRNKLPNIVEKQELIDTAKVTASNKRLVYSTKYDLISNICHDSPMGQGMSMEEPKDSLVKKQTKTASSSSSSSSGGSSSSGSGSNSIDVLGRGKFRAHILNKVM